MKLFDIGWNLTSSSSNSRKNFKVSTKREALENANYKCQKCKTKLRKSIHKKFGYVVEFDHWDNKPKNNKIRNCKVLCPTCHAQLTVIKKRKTRNIYTGLAEYKTIKKHSGVKRKRKVRSDKGKKKVKKSRNPYDFSFDLRI
jgi:ssDNA-binding Zn-finger/Zn-ribbon topoisomerase 1